MSKSRQSIGQLLLARVKCLDGYSAEDLDKMDCVLLECVKGEKVTRPAHRCVLEVGSDFLAQEVAKLQESRGTQSDAWSNTLRLDISGKTIDIILEYLYLRGPVQISDSLGGPALIAAKKLGLNELEEQALAHCLKVSLRLLQDDIFHDRWNSAADGESLDDIMADLHVDEAGRCSFKQSVRSRRVDDVGSSSKMESHIDGRSASPIPESPSSSAHATMAIFGKKLGERGHYCIISVPSMEELWYHRPVVVSDGPSPCSIIINDHLYSPIKDRIFVRRLASNELVDEIAGFTDIRIKGVSAHGDNVFFFTKDDMFALDARGRTCTKLASEEDGVDSYFPILEWDGDEFSAAVPNYETREVWSRTYASGCTTPVRSVKLQDLPRYMAPIGSHKGLLYFFTQRGPPFYYEAFRDGEKVKKESIDKCKDIQDLRLLDGRLYLACEFEGRITKVRCVCVIDLDTDTMICKKTVAQLGLVDLEWLIPVVRRETPE